MSQLRRARSIPLLRSGFLRRRGLVFVLCLLIGLVASKVIVSHVDSTWTATAYAEVNSGAGSGGPGDALDAAELASSYAYVIPNDREVLRSVSSATGSSVGVVGSSMDVYAANGAAELVLSYSASSAAVAVRGATAMAQAVTAGRTSSPAIAPGSVSLVSIPVSAQQASSRRVLAFGLLGSVLLALAVTLAAERRTPRIDDETELEEVLGSPVMPFHVVSSSAATTLVDLWSRAADATDGILLTAAVPAGDPRCRSLADTLSALCPAARLSLMPSPLSGAVPPVPGSGVVMVVERGAKARDVLLASTRLSLLGSRVIWGVLADRKPRWKLPTASAGPISRADVAAAAPTGGSDATGDRPPSDKAFGALFPGNSLRGAGAVGHGSRGRPEPADEAITRPSDARLRALRPPTS
jgi:hypothetical protein